jgi:hypothetical protein
LSEGIAVTGLGSVVAAAGERLDVARFLREPKARKYLGRQDELAVLSAGRALQQAGLSTGGPCELGERTGLFVAVGYIPFESRDIDPVLDRSLEGGRFSMTRFADGGYQRAHPLLAFRCLPNMPAYHVAANFGVEGPYHVAYPSAGQLYLALEQACEALHAGRVDRALVCGVAHQQNFLVEHHHRRVGVDPTLLRDAGATAVLEREADAGTRALARLERCEIRYQTFDPLAVVPPRRDAQAEELGPGSLWIALADRLGAPFTHELASRDGISATSSWLP